MGLTSLNLSNSVKHVSSLAAQEPEQVTMLAFSNRPSSPPSMPQCQRKIRSNKTRFGISSYLSVFVVVAVVEMCYCVRSLVRRTWNSTHVQFRGSERVMLTTLSAFTIPQTASTMFEIVQRVSSRMPFLGDERNASSVVNALDAVTTGSTTETAGLSFT